MRQTIRPDRMTAKPAAQHDATGTLALGAIVSAAVLVALFTLHGTPDLLAGKLPAFATASAATP